MKIVYLDDIEFDLLSGRDFYEKQQPGIGDYFLDSILADTESLILVFWGSPELLRILPNAWEDVSIRDLITRSKVA